MQRHTLPACVITCPLMPLREPLEACQRFSPPAWLGQRGSSVPGGWLTGRPVRGFAGPLCNNSKKKKWSTGNINVLHILLILKSRGYQLGALWKENINPAEVMSAGAIWGKGGKSERRRGGVWTPPDMYWWRWRKLIFACPLLGIVR